jgi:hypothetical protein
VNDPQTAYCLVTPSGIFAPTTPTSVTFTWGFASDGAVPNWTEILRNGGLVAQIPYSQDAPNGPYSYTDSNLTPSTSYTYNLCSVYGDGTAANHLQCASVGVRTAGGSAGPPPSPNPARPSSPGLYGVVVRLLAHTETSITVSWNDTADGAGNQVELLCTGVKVGEPCDDHPDRYGYSFVTYLEKAGTHTFSNLIPGHSYQFAACEEVGSLANPNCGSGLVPGKSTPYFPIFETLPYQVNNEIVWHNATTNETQIWNMRGQQVASRQTVLGEDGNPAYIGLPFSIVGLGALQVRK